MLQLLKIQVKLPCLTCHLLIKMKVVSEVSAFVLLLLLFLKYRFRHCVGKNAILKVSF